MSTRPIIAPEQLERFARELGLTQAILTGWASGGPMHVVTWGDSLTDSAQAAQGGNFVKRALGFPETLCRTLSPRVATALEIASIARVCVAREWDEECLAPWDQLTALCRDLDGGKLDSIIVACDAIPDITISIWACDPGNHWNSVREALRARRRAQGLDVDAANPDTAFDEQGWLKQRREPPSLEPARASCRRCVECEGLEHHWLTSMPECPEGGDPFIPCKHCDARAAVCDDCGEGAVWPPAPNSKLCAECSASGGA